MRLARLSCFRNNPILIENTLHGASVIGSVLSVYVFVCASYSFTTATASSEIRWSGYCPLIRINRLSAPAVCIISCRQYSDILSCPVVPSVFILYDTVKWLGFRKSLIMRLFAALTRSLVHGRFVFNWIACRRSNLSNIDDSPNNTPFVTLWSSCHGSALPNANKSLARG